MEQQLNSLVLLKWELLFELKPAIAFHPLLPLTLFPLFFPSGIATAGGQTVTFLRCLTKNRDELLSFVVKGSHNVLPSQSLSFSSLNIQSFSYDHHVESGNGTHKTQTHSETDTISHVFVKSTHSVSKQFFFSSLLFLPVTRGRRGRKNNWEWPLIQEKIRKCLGNKNWTATLWNRLEVLEAKKKSLSFCQTDSLFSRSPQLTAVSHQSTKHIFLSLVSVFLHHINLLLPIYEKVPVDREVIQVLHMRTGNDYKWRKKGNWLTSDGEHRKDMKDQTE